MIRPAGGPSIVNGLRCDNRSVTGMVQEVRNRPANRLLLRRQGGDRQGKGVGRGRQGDPYPRPGRPQRRGDPRARGAGRPHGGLARRCGPRGGRRDPGARRAARHHAAGRGTRPRHHRRHVHLGDPGAARTRQARRGGVSHHPARDPEAPGGRRPARVRARRHRGRRRGGLGPDPPAQAHGAHLPEHPAAVEVREARGLPRAIGATNSRSSTPSAPSPSGGRRTRSRRRARST